ncbi:MAG: OmpH family outer membrane protein [Candidatus Brocadiia bacterium]
MKNGYLKSKLWTLGIVAAIVLAAFLGIFCQSVVPQGNAEPVADSAAEPVSPTDVAPVPLPEPVKPLPAKTVEGLTLKIGVVNVQAVFDKYNRTSEYTKIMENERRRLELKLEDLKKEIQTLQEEIQMLDVNSELRAEKQLYLKGKISEYENRVEAGNKLLQKKRDEHIMKIYKEIKEVISNYAMENGYTLIFKIDPTLNEAEATANASEQVNLRAVIYAHPSLDITNIIIKVLNKE